MKNLMLIPIFLCCNFLIVNAQSETPLSEIEQFIADVYEQYAEESETEPDFNVFYEELIFLNQHPLDLNQAEREELAKMMFLSDIQIENILYYRYKAERFFSIYELMLVEGLDMTDIRRMLPFVTLTNSNEKDEKIDLKKYLKYGKNEILIRADYVPEQKEGYRLQNMGDSTGYMGSRIYNHLKYRFHYKDKLWLSITAEKDAGEPFFGKLRMGYDYTSVSFQFKNRGIIRNVIIGDYQAGFGQGLVLSQAFSRGKSAMTTKVCDLTGGFKRYGSTNEFNFFRGLAISLQQEQTSLHVFFSGRQLDGKVEQNVFPAFYETGYHRTMDEMLKRNKVKQNLAGFNLDYNGVWYQIGVSSLVMKMDKKLIPKRYPYNLFYFSGNKQWVSGFHYRFRLHKFNFFGEAALSNFEHPALICGLTVSPLSRVNLALLYRNYGPEYDALFATSFSEKSGVRNEKGVYIGAEILPAKNWKIAFYADSYRFPWLRYGVDSPSNGKDYLLLLTYTPLRRLTLICRTKYEQQVANLSGSEEASSKLSRENKVAFRFQSVYETGIIKFKQQFDANIVHNEHIAPTYGITALQEVSVRFRKWPLNIDFSYLFFDVQAYDNRIYLYEKNILYAFSMPAFSGIGSRYYVNLSYDFNKNLGCWLRYAGILYMDRRESIGSGKEMIAGNRKSEINCLVRLKF